jgi:hypothetical protein
MSGLNKNNSSCFVLNLELYLPTNENCKSFNTEQISTGIDPLSRGRYFQLNYFT